MKVEFLYYYKGAVLKMISKQLNVLLFVLCAFSLVGCGGGDTKRAKRNKLYELKFHSASCNQTVKKSFASEDDLCNYVSYEAQKAQCLNTDYSRAYTDHKCHRRSGSNLGNNNPQHIGQFNSGFEIQGELVIGASGHVGFDKPQQIVTTIIPHPVDNQVQQPIYLDQDTTSAQEKAIASIQAYYNLDSSGCFAHVKRSSVVIDISDVDPNCGGEAFTQGGGGIVKDAPREGGSASIGLTPEEQRAEDERRNAPRQEYRPEPPVATLPAERSSSASTTSSTNVIRPQIRPSTNSGVQVTTPASGQPASEGSDVEVSTPSSNNNAKLNTLYYSARSLVGNSIPHPQRSNERLETLMITARIDSSSPISGLKHQNYSDSKNVRIDISTTCPLKAKLTSAPSTAIVTLFTDISATTEQILSCKTLFASLESVNNFELQFTEPLVMTNGAQLTGTFKFINQ